MKQISFKVTEEVLNLGVVVQTIQINGIQKNKQTQDLDLYIKKELQKIRKVWEGKNYKDDPVLQGFRDLHKKVGESNRDYPASPEVLLRNFLERNRFPRINALVDLYNLLSLKTRLALGAHDIDKIIGDVTLRITTGSEIFVPLRINQSTRVPAGEYAYIDDGNNIICRMEVLQSEITKITTDSKDIFFIVEGNVNTNQHYVKQTTDALLHLIQKYCGGNY